MTNRLNNKGMTIVEIVLTFSLIMIIIIGLLTIVVNYRNRIAVSLEKLKLETFKNNVTQDVYNDILKFGVEKIEDFSDTNDSSNKCYGLNLNRCIVITFQNGEQKEFGTSKVDIDDRNSIINKYIFYDGIKYKLKDILPDTLPEGSDETLRHWRDLQTITINDDGIFNSNHSVLEDGTQVYIYNIDIGISHIDYEDDFGIHIIASNIDISK